MVTRTFFDRVALLVGFVFLTSTAFAQTQLTNAVTALGTSAYVFNGAAQNPTLIL